MAPGYPSSTKPKTCHWDVDVSCTIPLSAVNAGSHSAPGHPWWLLRIITKFSYSFYAQGATLCILSSNLEKWHGGSLCETNFWNLSSILSSVSFTKNIFSASWIHWWISLMHKKMWTYISSNLSVWSIKLAVKSICLYGPCHHSIVSGKLEGRISLPIVDSANVG